MAKGFTVKANAPKKKTQAPEWDIAAMSHSSAFFLGAFALTVNPFAMFLKLLQFNYSMCYVVCQ